MSTSRIPLVNLDRLWQRHGDEYTEAMLQVARSSAFILGEVVDRFEEAFAAATGARYAVGCASGTDAVHLALRAAGIGAGDEVITAPNTFAATVEAIVHAGARPVLVDVDDRTLLIDCDAVEEAITGATRAIVPVHLSGRPVDLPRLEKIAERHGLALIQDSAQAHGATVAGKPLGAYGHASCYSFFPGKNLGAFGDAGGITTDDEALARRLRSLRDHGRSGKYEHDEVGFNSRLDPLQAAVLLRKLPHLEEWNRRRTEVAARYRALLGGAVRMVDEQRDATEVYHHFMIRVPRRDDLRRALGAAGIASGIHYPIPIHLLRAFEWLGAPEGSFPVAEAAAGEILSLPIDPMITDEEVQTVAEAVLAFVQ